MIEYLSVNQFKSILDAKDVPQCCVIFFIYLISELFNVFCLFILSVLFCFVMVCLFIVLLYYVASIRALLQKSPVLSQFLPE